MLTATNIDRGFNSVVSFNLHARTFALSNQEDSQIIKKKGYSRTGAFHNKFNNGQAHLNSRQQVQRLQDKAEWPVYILYFGGTVMQIAIRQ